MTSLLVAVSKYEGELVSKWRENERASQASEENGYTRERNLCRAKRSIASQHFHLNFVNFVNFVNLVNFVNFVCQLLVNSFNSAKDFAKVLTQVKLVTSNWRKSGRSWQSW